MKIRTGFTLIEACVSCGILTVLIMMSVSFLSTAMKQMRLEDHQELGLWEASNQLELLTNLSVAELSQRLSAKIEPSIEALRQLPDCNIEVKRETTDLKNLQKLTVQVRWKTRTAEQKVQLSAFVHSPEVK